MKCPGCNHEFKLTVREYLREPGGRHNCPACGMRFKILWTLSYIVILVLAVLFLAVGPGTIVFYYTRNWFLYGATVVVCATIFVLPIDIWLDDKWRRTAKL